MNATALTPQQQSEVDRQVSQMLARNPSFARLPTAAQADIRRNTTAIVAQMARSTPRTSDPYARGMAGPQTSLPVHQTNKKKKPSANDNVGITINKGVDMMARVASDTDVGFPNFVSGLIQNTFHAIVTASIEQMQAYAQLVKSVAQTLSEFRDENTTANQGRDALIGRYPQLFQLKIGDDGQPTVTAKEGAEDADLPNFQSDLGLDEEITDIDDETIEQKLVPAARDELAKSRQQLLATTVLMGINRIVVTDGKINAKVRFTFQAVDAYRQHAAAYDYGNYGNDVAAQSSYETDEDTPQSNAGYSSGGYSSSYSAKSRYSTGQYQYASTPVVKVTSENTLDTQGQLTGAGMLSGEVSVNFKSETFPLEKMVDTNQMMMLQNARTGAGRATPAADSGTASATAPPPTSTPAIPPATAKA